MKQDFLVDESVQQKAARRMMHNVGLHAWSISNTIFRASQVKIQKLTTQLKDKESELAAIKKEACWRVHARFASHPACTMQWHRRCNLLLRRRRVIATRTSTLEANLSHSLTLLLDVGYPLLESLCRMSLRQWSRQRCRRRRSP